MEVNHFYNNNNNNDRLYWIYMLGLQLILHVVQTDEITHPEDENKHVYFLKLRNNSFIVSSCPKWPNNSFIVFRLAKKLKW